MRFFLSTLQSVFRALGKLLLTGRLSYSEILVRWRWKKQKIQCLMHLSIWLIGRLFIINNPQCLEMSVARPTSRWILTSWVAAESCSHPMWRIKFDKIMFYEKSMCYAVILPAICMPSVAPASEHRNMLSGQRSLEWEVTKDGHKILKEDACNCSEMEIESFPLWTSCVFVVMSCTSNGAWDSLGSRRQTTLKQIYLFDPTLLSLR